MFTSDPDTLSKLQRRTEYIRNLCILAHVDHGKTTLSDHLLSSNGIISNKLAGRIRYLDSRPDEQERAITMKSSSIALLYQTNAQRTQQPTPLATTIQDSSAPSSSASSSPPTTSVSSRSIYLMNLIDSPGHVDFSSEVSTAVRCSDGALVLVDIVEGLQVQTVAVLGSAWREGLSVCLVLNKIDRLIVETRHSPLEAYRHIVKVLEDINAVASTFITADAMKAASLTDGNVDIDDDAQFVFSPAAGNVMFASSVDGWAFTIKDFATFYSKKLGMNARALQSALWGDHYFNAKEKKVTTKPVTSKSSSTVAKPMFVQFILDAIWQVYSTCEGEYDEHAIHTLIDKLGLTASVPPREVSASSDKRRRVNAIMSRWLPLAPCALQLVVDKLPDPVRAQQLRMDRLWRAADNGSETEIHRAMLNCDIHAPTVMIYVAKMIDMSDALKQKRGGAQSDKIVRTSYVKRKPPGAEEETKHDSDNIITAPTEQKESESTPPLPETTSDDRPHDRFIAFARVFSGTLSNDQDTAIHVYGPKYNAAQPNNAYHTVISARSLQLYVLMATDLQAVSSIPAGNVCGIGGLSEVILKTGSLSTAFPVTPFLSMHYQAAPIVRVAIEPESAADLAALGRGLELLNQADPNIIVTLVNSGEWLICASGELHVERCIRDLHDRFAVGVKLRVSPPIVSYRETVIEEERKESLVEKRKEKKIAKLKASKPKRIDGDDDQESEDNRYRSYKAEEDKKRVASEHLRIHNTTNSLDTHHDSSEHHSGNAAHISGSHSNNDIAGAASPTETQSDRTSEVDPSAYNPPLAASKHKFVVEERTANGCCIIRVLCVPLGVGVIPIIERANKIIRSLLKQKENFKSKWIREDRRANNEQDLSLATEKLPDEDASAVASNAVSKSIDVSTEPQPPTSIDNNVSSDIPSPHDDDDIETSTSPAVAADNELDTDTFLKQLREVFKSASDLTEDDVDRIMAFGPHRTGSCVLINRVADLNTVSSLTSNASTSQAEASDRLALFVSLEQAIINGFHLATTAGPMCEEPMCAVAFIILSLTLTEPPPHHPAGPMSGQLLSTMRSACRRAFTMRAQRLVEGFYSVTLMCVSDELGPLYAVMARRRGRIDSESSIEGTNSFLISGILPIAESFGFASEIRSATGGEASPQLVWCGWNLIISDPYFVPTSEEDIERSGSLEEGRNVARECMISVRRRKGLSVREKVVAHAEKQRTLARKK